MLTINRIKISLCFFLLALSIITKGQSVLQVKDKLIDVKNAADLNKLIDELPNWEIAMIHLTKEETTGKLATLFQQEMGAIVLRKDEGTGVTYLFKSMEMDAMHSYRSKHIFFDGRRMTKAEIDKVRNKVKAEYAAGTAFDDLFEKYADPHGQRPHGDMGWFKEMTMIAEYERAVKQHQIGDLFEVNIPDRNQYYLVLKTHPNKVENQLAVICIKVEEDNK